MKSLLTRFCLVFFNLAIGLLSVQEAAHADRDMNRPTQQIAVDLGVSEEVFRTCFDPVHPDRNKAPSATRQHMNKAKLLPCLQKANPRLTNERLDHVMDRYRPEGPMLGGKGPDGLPPK